MNDLMSLFNLWNNAMLNTWEMLRSNGGIWFYVVVAIVIVFPVLKKMVRAIRGNR